MVSRPSLVPSLTSPAPSVMTIGIGSLMKNGCSPRASIVMSESQVYTGWTCASAVPETSRAIPARAAERACAMGLR